MARPNPRRNISRIELVSTAGNLNCGWEVRIMRRGKKVEKFFSDNGYGGKTQALRAAKEYRDKLEATMKPYTVAERAKKPSKRNSSGVVGVRKSYRKDIRDGYEYTYYCWVAQWTDGKGRRRTKSFSIDKFGDEKAFQKAVAARKKGIKESEKEK